MVAVVVAALFAGNALGFRDAVLGGGTPAPVPVAVSRVAGGSSTQGTAPVSVERSQPWWQQVTTFSGSGSATTAPFTTAQFTIAAGALQWRVKWSCTSGNLSVRTVPAPARAKALIQAPCPGHDTAYGVQTGALRLAVATSGSWQLEVDQQVDVPLVQAPTPAMAAPGSVVVEKGTFYDVDQSASGTVTIYRLADGTYALRLGGFFVTPNVDLEIHLSPLVAPHSTPQYLSAPSSLVAALDVTAGSLNFTVPPGVDPTQFRSVVIWCELLHSAYGAAALSSTAPAPAAPAA